jgi:hypothetical protein
MTPREIALFWSRQRHGTIEDKFWARVEREPGCWHWQGAISTWGYGFLHADGRVRHAHRVSWEINVGPIPEGMMVCHHCDVRDCVNPDHLFLGTAKDNVADMIAKGRRADIVPPSRRGEEHYAARLSDVVVSEIRAAVAAGELHRLIALRYGVTRQYVGMLAKGARRVA